MFRQLIDTAKLSVSNTVSKFAGRAGVGVAMLIAALFLLLAITAWLIDRFGAPLGYLIMRLCARRGGGMARRVGARASRCARPACRAGRQQRDRVQSDCGRPAGGNERAANGPEAADDRDPGRPPGRLMMRRANRGPDDRHEAR